MQHGEPHWTGRVELIESQLEIPLHWRKPLRIFVNSMSDTFHEKLPDQAIDRIFAVMALCPQHMFIVLTKRPERMRDWVGKANNSKCAEAIGIGRGVVRSGSWITPIENVWLGVSVEDQKTADERIPLLLQTPAAVRFISLEPMLGPVELQRSWLSPYSAVTGDFLPRTRDGQHYLDLVIIGGESGQGARPCEISWIRSVIDQCAVAGVACFVKQLGAFPIVAACRQNHFDWGEGIGRTARFSATDKLHPSTEPWRIHLKDSKGGDMSEWPEHLRVRQMPEER
jgi:protein gp37